MADIQSFIQTYGPAAAASAAQLGTTPQNVLGHWGLETGWGQHVIPGTLNMGNIKSTDGSGVTATDNQNGSRDNYAAYSTPQAAAQAYTNLLSSQRYAGVQGAQDPTQFASALKSGGYAEDPNYVPKLVNAINMVSGAGGAPQAAPDGSDQKAALAAQVTQDYAAGTDPMTIVSGLLKTNLAGPDVLAALKKGVSPDRIVAVVGGAPLAQFKATDPGEQVKQQSFLQNLAQGAGNAASDMGLGAQQLFNTDPTQAASLQAQAAANQQDPTRQALSHTVGGTIGSEAVKAIPTIAATALAPETMGGSLALLGGAGAVQGALTPTTADGQRTKNVLIDGALGAGGGAVGSGLGSLSKTAAAALSPTAQAGTDAAELAAQRAALGWNSTVADLNPAARAIRDAFPSAKAASEDQMRQDMNSVILDRIGQTGTELSPENVAIARNTIYQPVDDALAGVTVPADTSAIAPKLQNIVQQYEADTLPTYRSPEVASAANDVLNKISTGNMSADALLQAKKNILGNAWKADGDTKTALRSIGDAINDHLGSIAPDVTPALQTANQQWQHLQVVENALNRVNGQGDLLTPRSFAQSVKATNRDQFQAGNAPYQDVADTLLKSQGANSSQSLAGLAAKHLGASDNHFLTGAAFFEPHIAIPAMLAKAAATSLGRGVVNSSNPALIRMLTGAGSTPTNPIIAQYIAKALQGAGGVTASALDPT